ASLIADDKTPYRFRDASPWRHCGKRSGLAVLVNVAPKSCAWSVGYRFRLPMPAAKLTDAE
ncbi:MAG: hypothetical protein AAGM04_13360, partial [Pseudomonadota bacterium]